MNFSANLSLLFHDVPLTERFGRAARAGFNHVEIQFPYELSPDRLTAVLSEHRLKLDLINLPAGDLMSGGRGLAGDYLRQNDFVQALRQGMEYAHALNVKKINILSGRKSLLTKDYAPDWVVLVDNIRLACHELLAAGIQPLVEVINPVSMPGFWLDSLAMYDRLYEAVAVPALQLQFDIFHVAMTGHPVLEALEKYRPHIGHIQFADWPGRHQPGTGKLDFTAIFNRIAQLYPGMVAAEYIPAGRTEDGLDWFHQYRT